MIAGGQEVFIGLERVVDRGRKLVFGGEPIGRAEHLDAVFRRQHRAEALGIVDIPGDITASVKVEDNAVEQLGFRSDPLADEIAEDVGRIADPRFAGRGHQLAQLCLSVAGGFEGTAVDKGFEQRELPCGEACWILP